MRTVLLASMRHHTRRYVAASVAVVIGVAFVVVTGMLTDATRSGMTADVGAPVAGVDHVVTTYDTEAVARLVDAAAEEGFPALTLGHATEPVTRDGVQLTQAADVAEASLDPALQWQVVEDGRHLIVSGGLGCSGIPVRFGVPPEIVVIDIGELSGDGSVAI